MNWDGTPKLTRKLTVEFQGEQKSPEMDELRTTLTNLSDRVQSLCNEKTKANFQNVVTPPAYGFPPPPTSKHPMAFRVPNQPPLVRQHGRVLQPAVVAPLITLSNNSEWSDKVMLKFEPDDVPFTGESTHLFVFFP